MPSDGMYKGEVVVSLQCKLNNSAIKVSLRDPEIKKEDGGYRLIEGSNEVCISNRDVESIVQIGSGYGIYYGKSNLMIGIIFWAA